MAGTTAFDTFFAIVTDDRLDEDERVRLWLGVDFHEVATVEALREALDDYADLPPEVAAKLFLDRAVRFSL